MARMLKCFLLACLVLICVSNGKVVAEQTSDCVIQTGITMFAKPIMTDKDQKDCDCYHIETITTFRLTGTFDTDSLKNCIARQSHWLTCLNWSKMR